MRALLAFVALALAGPAPAADAPRSPRLDPPWRPWTYEATGPRGVQDPHYGDSLFYFFQSRYFTSVTNLMVSQHFGRMPVHGDEAEVLRGGLFLSYGLHREAGEVFEKLIARGAPPRVRDRAWYYLAKIRYQRGLHDEAQAALARIEQPLPAALEEDRQLLAANVLMARNDFAGAVRVLDGLAKTPGITSYARYNLGVALVKSGDVAKGTGLLDEVGKQPVQSEELRSLRDQANVALGFTALQSNAGASARDYLQRVRLQGLHSNRALLGFGWAAAAEGDVRAALAPWTELTQRDPSDAAVLEAKLAVPFAYAELGAYAQSLALYQDAIAVYERETSKLDETIAAIKGGLLVKELLERNPGEEMGWFWSINDVPELPYRAQLAPILAQHEFQEAFKNYRDLLFLGGNLRQWDEGLSILRDMLANRRLALSERLPAVRERNRAINLDELEWRRDALRVELERVEREFDVAAFADALEREQQQRLDRARETLDWMSRDDVQYIELRDRYRRALGALRWQQAQKFPERLWQAKKVMMEVERSVARARIGDAALTAAQRDEPGRLDDFGKRIEGLDARVKALLPQVAELTTQQQAAVQGLVVAELGRQKERLAGYLSQARFAVAQLYDRANSGAAPTGAAPAREGSNAPAR